MSVMTLRRQVREMRVAAATRSNRSVVDYIPPDAKAAAAAKSLNAFATEMLDVVPAEHHRLMTEKLEAVARGEITRVMLFMPPGSGKSTYASVAFPPYFMGRNPSKNIITASYGQRLSVRFGKKARNIIARPRYRDIFGFGLATDSSAKDEWETERGGEFTATSVDGAVTGRRGNAILVDDPIKGRKQADSPVIRDTAWEWWKSDLRPRLKPGGALILTTTRWHEDDIAGRILPADYDGQSGDITARDGEVWHVVSLKAEAEAGDPLGRKPGEFIWPEWFTNGMLAREKIIQGPRNWSALYQQRPSPEQGDYFLKDWIRWYDEPPPRATLRTYGASDYAVTADGGDFTVHGVAGLDPTDDLYILDWWRKQTASDVWVETVIDLMDVWRPLQWGEEKGQIEKGVGPFLQKRQIERRVHVWREQYVSDSDKPTRAQSIRGRMAMGKVLFPRNAPWVNDLVSELLRFPTGVNDDQVDVLSLFGRMLDRMIKGTVPKPPAPAIGELPTWDQVMAAQPRRARTDRL
jgi:predicted phage terminase large subunit-like protein